MPVERAVSDEAEFRALWMSDAPLSAIAAHYRLSPAIVRRYAWQFRLPPRPEEMARARGWWTPERDAAVFATEGQACAIADLARAWRRPISVVRARWAALTLEGFAAPAAPEAPEAAKAAAPVPGGAFWTPSRDAEIARSGGRYAALAALAEKWGQPMRALLARWHRLRAA